MSVDVVNMSARCQSIYQPTVSTDTMPTGALISSYDLGVQEARIPGLACINTSLVAQVTWLAQENTE